MILDCSRCRHRNPPDSRYCRDCGASLLQGSYITNYIHAYPSPATSRPRRIVWTVIAVLTMFAGYLIGVAS